ncbi:MAG: AmpG family muropeptide MFS transporter [Gammaproteobacteria bacterium]
MSFLLHNKLNPRISTVLFLAFSSALPLALTNSTLQAWFTQAGVGLATIGALTLIGIPYNLKFLWAPVMDRFVPPFLGRRRGWICLMQLGLCIALFMLANMSPAVTPMAMGFLALFIAFLSASQDIAIDAYRADILLPEERGLGAAVTIFAARIAMLVSGGLALVIADHFGWQITYELMAVFMAIFILATYFGPDTPKNIVPPNSFAAAIIDPFKDLLKRDGIGLILLFVVFYKIGDALALSLMSNFLLHNLGFSLTDVGVAYKTFGLIATIVGAFAGGVLLTRLNLYWALLLFGLAQAFSNLLFMILAYAGKNYLLMVSAIFIESFCSGMSTAALLAFLMSLCHQQYSATQYAFLSALFSIGRVFLGPVAAAMVAHLGWITFYFWTFLACFPGIIMLILLRSRVNFNAEAFQT